MPVFAAGPHRVLFAHIPKTGGTSVEQFFVTGAGFPMTWFEESFEPQTKITMQHFHASLLRQIFNYDQFQYMFTIVRDPISRFRSEYCYYHKGRIASTSSAHVERWASKMIQRTVQDPSWSENHFRPQIDFIEPDFDVLRFEDGFKAIQERICANVPSLPRDVDMPHLFKSDSLGGVHSQDVPISTRLEGMLREFYKNDYLQLGY